MIHRRVIESNLHLSELQTGEAKFLSTEIVFVSFCLFVWGGFDSRALGNYSSIFRFTGRDGIQKIRGSSSLSSVSHLHNFYDLPA